jgi:A1 cistron-splicing factor AAR2
LTGYIDEGLLERVLGGRTQRVVEVRAGEEAGGRDWTISSISSAPQDAEKIPGLSASESVVEGEKELNFLAVDLKKTWRDGAVGRERTDAARDRSWYLGRVIEEAGSGDRKLGTTQVLGELQLCFLMVMTLANWSCLEQWKRILGVLLSCRQALEEVEDYFVAVVRLLGLQLRHCEDVEGGLFDFKEEGAGWLRGLLGQFRGNVEEVFGTVGGETLKEELKKVEEYLRNEYGWERGKDVLRRGLLELEDGERVDMDMDGADEEDETGEYAPVVVDLG